MNASKVSRNATKHRQEMSVWGLRMKTELPIVDRTES